MSARALPDDLVLKVIRPENIVEHHLDVMTRVPVAMVKEVARLLQHTVQFPDARTHVGDIRQRVAVAVVKSAFLGGIAPKHLVVAVRVEWRVDINQVDAFRREVPENLKAVSAVDRVRLELNRLKFWRSC